MGNMIRFIVLGLLGLIFIVVGLLLFTVSEHQQALVLQFGAPKRAINATGTDESGLHLKSPLENVVYFDRRNLEFDLPRSLEIIVANEERLLVDGFVRYKITDPLRYFQTLGATASDPDLIRGNLNNRLTNVLSESMRQVLGEVQIRDIITTRRTELMRAIQDDVTEEAAKFGVAIIDVRIRQADFPPENAVLVYERMESDYKQQAERIRANGDRRAREIRAQANKERVQILANARQEGEEIRGRADATRNCIFAGAYQGVPVLVEEIIPDIVEETLDEDGAPIVAPGRAVERPNFQGQAANDALNASQQVSCRFVDPGATGDSQRSEFFAFYRSLSAYESSLMDGSTTIILSPDSDFFQYFNSNGAN